MAAVALMVASKPPSGGSGPSVRRHWSRQHGAGDEATHGRSGTDPTTTWRGRIGASGCELCSAGRSLTGHSRWEDTQLMPEDQKLQLEVGVRVTSMDQGLEE